MRRVAQLSKSTADSPLPRISDVVTFMHFEMGKRGVLGVDFNPNLNIQMQVIHPESHRAQNEGNIAHRLGNDTYS